MRVIAGTARRLPLVAPEGRDTRPTTDRIKETLFNVLQDEVPGCEFLDLFSGSGGIGIEAISRGAKHATFVEFGKEALACIKKNLSKTKLADKATVLPMEATYAIAKLGRQNRKYDIIYADPPYQKGWEEKILNLLSASKIAKAGSLVVVESSLGTPADYVDESCYEIRKIKEYKTNQHLFLQVK